MAVGWGPLDLREEGDSWDLGKKAAGGSPQFPEGGGHCGSKVLVP